MAPHDLAIVLHFIDFHLEWAYDFLSVYAGSTLDISEATRVVQLSGSSLPSDIVSSGLYIWLVFSSDYALSYRGFHLEASVKNTTGKYNIHVNIVNRQMHTFGPQ